MLESQCARKVILFLERSIFLTEADEAEEEDTYIKDMKLKGLLLKLKNWACNQKMNQ